MHDFESEAFALLHTHTTRAISLGHAYGSLLRDDVQLLDGFHTSSTSPRQLACSTLARVSLLARD